MESPNASPVRKRQVLRDPPAWQSARRLGLPTIQVLTSRKALEMKLDEMKRKFANRQIPLPSFWGGFRVVPNTIEFWQGQPDRLHDRFQYVREGEGWHILRLAP